MKWSSNIDPQSDGDSETAAWGWDYPTQVLHSPQCCEKILAEPESMTHWCRTHAGAHTHTHMRARSCCFTAHTHTHVINCLGADLMCIACDDDDDDDAESVPLLVCVCVWGGRGEGGWVGVIYSCVMWLVFVRNVSALVSPEAFINVFTCFLMHFKQWHNLRCINTMYMFIVDYKHLKKSSMWCKQLATNHDKIHKNKEKVV